MFENNAFKAVMIMPRLLSHKASKNSKAKDHLIAFERRMKLWLKGDLIELFMNERSFKMLKRTTINKRDFIY